MKNEMSGGEAVARMLKTLGAGPIFGMGGFQLLPYYDAVRRLGLQHHLINDERCGVFAADAYAKITGRVGLVDATLGPGATNLSTGLVEALNSGTPLVAIIGDAHRGHAGKNLTQEARQIEILRPAVKEILRIEMIERIPELIRRAFQIATSGRPGPVIVDVPEDISHGTHLFPGHRFHADSRYEAAPALRCRPARDDLSRAAELLRQAERPIMLCGGGVHISDATDTVERFAHDYGIPVAHTLSGKGAIACTDPLSAGLFGRYDRIANDLIAASDCLLVVGCKLGEIATKRYTVPEQGKTIVHLDLVAEEFGRSYAPAVPLWGDVREGLIDLQTQLGVNTKMREGRDGWLAAVRERMEAWREEVRPRMESDERPVSMARLIHELNIHMPADGHLIADGGFAAHWGGLLYDTKQPGRGFVPDRGFASIGYGLPAAIGAALAAPERQIVSLSGDCGFNMVLGELETARRLNLSFTLIVVNNGASGYVKALQHLMYGAGNYQSSDLADTDYAATARNLGCQGIRVEHPGALADALQAGFAERSRPTILDVVVTRDPGKMLPGVDNRATTVRKGDRIA